MIRSKYPETSLFYASEDLHRPSRTNFYARLNAAVVHWGSLCAPLTECFHSEKNGRPVDPCVYFKIFLVGYLEGIVFDTDLAERVGDSLAVREFVGYGPAERTPDHSSLSRVRLRFSEGDVLERVMDRVVAMCSQAGLVSGLEVAVDSTLLPANASLSSLRSVKTGVSVREHLKRLREEGQKPSVDNQEFRSPSDPDARIAKKKGTPRSMCHKLTHVTDAKSQIVLSARVCPADVGESAAATVPLESAKRRLEASELELGTVVADAGYDDSKFHARIEAMEATPLTNYETASSPKAQGFAKADFVYDPERDLYACPAGELLTRAKGKGDPVVYRTVGPVCGVCPFKDACLSEKATRRVIRRSKDEASRERNIALCHTDEGRAALKRRKSVVEPPFGQMKRYGGLGKLNCRTTPKVQVKATIAAIGWNLKKLLKTLKGDVLNRLKTLRTHRIAYSNA